MEPQSESSFREQEVEWALTLAFCNRVLRWGMEREAEQKQDYAEKAKAWRKKAAWRMLREQGYRNRENG